LLKSPIISNLTIKPVFESDYRAAIEKDWVVKKDAISKKFTDTVTLIAAVNAPCVCPLKSCENIIS